MTAEQAAAVILEVLCPVNHTKASEEASRAKKQIKARYQELKDAHSFSDAARMARNEWLKGFLDRVSQDANRESAEYMRDLEKV